MTNEQKADEICKKHIFDSNHFDCCMEMAEWKDEQHAKEKQKLIYKAYEFWKHKFPYLDIYTMKEFVDTMKGE